MNVEIRAARVDDYRDNESGFVIEGTHKAFAFREGEYVDSYFMARVKP